MVQVATQVRISERDSRFVNDNFVEELESVLEFYKTIYPSAILFESIMDLQLINDFRKRAGRFPTKQEFYKFFRKFCTCSMENYVCQKQLTEQEFLHLCDILVPVRGVGFFGFICQASQIL